MFGGKKSKYTLLNSILGWHGALSKINKTFRFCCPIKQLKFLFRYSVKNFAVIQAVEFDFQIISLGITLLNSLGIAAFPITKGSIFRHQQNIANK